MNWFMLLQMTIIVSSLLLFRAKSGAALQFTLVLYIPAILVLFVELLKKLQLIQENSLDFLLNSSFLLLYFHIVSLFSLIYLAIGFLPATKPFTELNIDREQIARSDSLSRTRN